MSKTIKKPLIFLPIESTVRELDYKVNLARLFCAAGFDAIIGNPPFIRDELKYKNYKGIFLEKGVNPDPNYYQGLSDKGIYLYDLGDEGAAEPVYSINYEPAINALKAMRKIVLWGNYQKKDLVKRNNDPILSKKYNVLGNPGYDLCTPFYQLFNLTLKPKKLPKNYILINTNFGCVQSYTINDHLEACSLLSPLTEKMIEDGYKKESLQWPPFQEWLEDIIQSFPEEQFLIRPHPAEIAENYRKIFGKYKNAFISKEGNVNYVTASAKCVLHKDCSTAMQAYLMGVPSISLGGSALYPDYIQWPLNFSALPKTINDAKKSIAEILKNGQLNNKVQCEIDQKAKKVLEDCFANLGNSTHVLIDTILKDSQDLIQNFQPYKLIDNRSFLSKCKMLVRAKLPLSYKVPIAGQETMIEYHRKDIEKRLDLLENIDPTYCQFKIKKIFPNAFRIEKVR